MKMFTSVDTLGYMLMICLLGHTTLISFMKYIGIFYKIRNKLPMVILKIFTLHLYIRIFCMALKSMEI